MPISNGDIDSVNNPTTNGVDNDDDKQSQTPRLGRKDTDHAPVLPRVRALIGKQHLLLTNDFCLGGWAPSEVQGRNISRRKEK